MPPKIKFIKTQPIDVIDPITLDNSNIQSILNETNDIIVFTDNNTFVAVNTLNFSESTKTFVECKLKNNQLLPVLSSKGKNYFHIGFYLNSENNDLLIDFNTLKKIKNFNTNRIFKVDTITDPLPSVNLEELKLSMFTTGNDVYFDHLYRVTLMNYSHHWDQAMNNYLWKGEEYFDSNLFKQYWRRYGSFNPAQALNIDSMTTHNVHNFFIEPDDISQSVANVKKKIDDLDRCFLFVAPRYEKKINLWRGMNHNYKYPINNPDDVYISTGFLSCSTSIDTAISFTGFGGTLYKIEVDEGVPYIDMLHNSLHASEREILLPRGLKMTYVEAKKTKHKNRSYNYILIRLEMEQEDQFNRPTGCLPRRIAKFTPMIIQGLTLKKTKVSKPKGALKPKVSKAVTMEGCNAKNKDYNPTTKKCVAKCKSADYERNANFKCVKTCASLNKDYNPTTKNAWQNVNQQTMKGMRILNVLKKN